MENTPIIGHIYHVVDKTTGNVVKVGSTIYPLHKRFNAFYKRKYSNHFLREVRSIESTDLDWYEKKNPYCPFLWHLVAAEHIEMLRVDTFQKGVFSNKMSPLDQKACGFDGSVSGRVGGRATNEITDGRAGNGGRVGGRVSGAQAFKNKTGIFAPDFDKSAVGRMNTPAQLAAKRDNFAIGRTREHQIKAGIAAGIKNVESGWAAELGHTQGRKNVDNGHLARISKLGASLGASTRNHNQYHTKRGIVSPTCKLCK